MGDIILNFKVSTNVFEKIYLNSSKPWLKLEDLIIDSYSLASSSVDDYYHRISPPLKRQIITWTFIVIELFIAIKYFTMAIFKNKEIYYILGDTFIYLNRPDLIHYEVAYFTFMVTLWRITNLIMERKFICYNMDFGHEVIKDRNHELNETNYKRFTIKMYISVWFVRFSVRFATILCVGSFICNSL